MKQFIVMGWICFFCLKENHAQNLVPNGGFEQHKRAATMEAQTTYGPFEYADAWVNPQSGSPEHYQVGKNAPNTCCGRKTAYKGNGFMGIDTWNFGLGEHIEARLTSPLEDGKTYFVSFALSQSIQYPQSTDNFGVHFSEEFEISPGAKPTHNVYKKDFYPDTSWRYFYAFYEADGTEQFLTLGMVPVPWEVIPKPISNRGHNSGYMYVDEVCIYEFEHPNNIVIKDTTIRIDKAQNCQIEIGTTENETLYCIWNTGDTTQYLAINAPGVYWRRSFFPCYNQIDTFRVEFISTTETTQICKGDKLKIKQDSLSTISVLSGDLNSISCTNCDSLILSPHQNTMYLMDKVCIQDTLKVEVIAVVDFQLQEELIKCYKDTLSLPLTLTGDTSNYYIEWFPQKGLSNSLATQPICYADSNMEYTVKLTNKLHRCMDSASIKIINIYPDFITDTLVCLGESAKITNLSSGPVIDYYWNYASNQWVNAVRPDFIFHDSGSTIIRLVALPCKDTVSKTITIDSRMDLRFTQSKDSICQGELIEFIPYEIDERVTNLSYYIGKTNFVTAPSTVLRYSFTEEGIYRIEMQGQFRRCPDTSYTSLVFVFPTPEVYLGNDSSLCYQGKFITLQNLNTPSTNTNTYLWSTGDTAQSIQVKSPGLYSLTQRNAPIGCTGYGSIEISKDCFVDIPNAFTPNGDGVNDYFFPRKWLSRGIEKFHLQIFNRWGQLIYETYQTEGLGWDGKWNGKDQAMGVYVYRILVTFKNGTLESYEGNVTLMR